MSFEKILQIDDLTLYHALKELQILSEEELDRAILLCQEKNRNLATLLVDLGKIHSQEVPQILDHIQNPDNIKKSPSFQTLTHNPLALIGKNLGKYEVLRLIAQGGMGLVYEGLDPVLERRVALKILSPILSRDPEYRHRFLREARLLAKIHHPHVVGIYDFGETDSNLFIAFQFVEGRSLEEITREEKIPLPTLLKYIRQIAEGLQEAHNHGIIHRDVKPANILINPNGQAVLTDFGIAHVDDSDLTSSGKNLGTPLYMAPETLEGKPVDARSDIYSLGVTLYYGLTGVNPFAAPSPLEIISRHLQGNYKPLEEMGYFPKELSVFLKKLLARNPDDRPKNMEEVSKTLLKLEKKVQGVSLSSLLYRIKFPSFRQLGSYLKEGLAHPYSPYVLGFLGTLIFISLIWYVVSASLSSSRIPKRTRQGPFHSSYWEVLKKKTKVNLKKGLLDQAKFDLEEGKKYLPAPLMVQWRSLYDQIQKKIDSEKKAFQRALKEAEDYRVRNQFAQGISILRRFLNSGVISVADSSRNAIQKIKKEEKDFFEKEKKKIFIKIQNYAFLEALQECHWLSEKLSPHFHKDWQDFYEQVKIKMSKKFQQNFKQKKWFQLLEWYESLRNQPDSDLREKIEREYNNLKKHIQSSYQAFYSAYQKSFQWEKQGDYNRAIQVLLSFSKKYPSFFKDIIQGRVRRLQETQNQLPPRSHLVYGIYRSYIDGLIGTQSETYSLPRRLRKKVLKELKVGEGLEFILKGSKVKDIRKSHIAKVLAILETLKKEVPITIILKKGNPIHGILLGYSYSEILVGRKTNNLFLRIHAISWKDIQSLQVKE